MPNKIGEAILVIKANAKGLKRGLDKAQTEATGGASRGCRPSWQGFANRNPRGRRCSGWAGYARRGGYRGHRAGYRRRYRDGQENPRPWAAPWALRGKPWASPPSPSRFTAGPSRKPTVVLNPSIRLSCA